MAGVFYSGGSGWIVRDYALTTRTAQTAQSLFSPTIVSNQWFSSHHSITKQKTDLSVGLCLVGVGGLFVTTHSPHVRLKQRKACFRQLSCRTSGSHLTTLSPNKKPTIRSVYVWWEWVDSNHLRLKPTDLQSAPALQLRRTPNLVFRPPAPKASVGNGFSALASLR